MVFQMISFKTHYPEENHGDMITLGKEQVFLVLDGCLLVACQLFPAIPLQRGCMTVKSGSGCRLSHPHYMSFLLIWGSWSGPAPRVSFSACSL